MTDWQFSSLGESLAWLDRHVNLEAIERGVAGAAGAPTLDRIRALLDAMGEPQRDYPVVHVTGTNGKGSTTRLVSALLAANGLSVGTMTSPHLESINERIARDGVPISDADFAETLDALRALEGFFLSRSPGAIPPTWFELMTAAGYRYFSDVAVEAAVVEVGLGGRYDATNAADGLVAVVTNVELDHTEILGPTRAHVAAEKSGIIKAGATAVVGETDPDLVEIFEREADLVGAAAFWRRGADFDLVSNQLAHGGRVLELRTPGRDYDGLYLPLFGAHQGLNASVAVVAAEAFFGEPLGEDVVAEAFAAVTVPGRLEVVGHRPLVVLDGAHNAAGAIALGQALREDFSTRARTILVMGCLAGRSPRELLEGIGPEQISEVVACRPDSPRAQPAEAVLEAAEALSLPASAEPDVAEALARAFMLAEPDDLVVVSGSLYVVGAARQVVTRLGSSRS